MKFAINYSKAVDQVFTDIQNDFDYCKCNEWASIKDPAKLLKPIYVHYPNNVGNKQGEPDWAMIEQNLKESQSPLINVHLIATVEQYPHIPIDSVDTVHTEEIITNALADIEQFTKRFGAQNIIVENLPYWYPRQPREIGMLRCAAAASTISTVIKESNTALLLDIDHARIAAFYLQVDPKEYIQTLPVHTLKELHMTGTRMYEGYLEAHLEMRDEDWPYFEWALQNISNGTWATPAIFANEYSGTGPHFAWRSEPEFIAQQVPKFAALLKKYKLRS